VNWLACGSSLIEKIEKLACHDRTGIDLLERPALADHIGGAVRALDAFIPGTLPPGLYILDLFLEQSILRSTRLFNRGQQLE
jgi:hypothetical protein